MSLRINTNISAMTAMRELHNTENRLQGSIMRLSTGLRINSAGDDPAGMIVSEGLRSTVKGIQQAVRNSQDAINMTKTAEGALDEVSRLILSMRALAVSSANTAVVDGRQLQANQTQIRESLASLTRIAEQTTWGSKKLLNGAAGVSANITQTNMVASASIGSEFNGEIVRSGNIQMTRVQASTKTSTTLTTTYATSGTVVGGGTFAINGIAFTTEPGETVGSLLGKINAKSHLTNVLASHVPGSGITLLATDYGSQFPIHYIETSNILNSGASAMPAVGNDAIYNVTVPVEPSPNTAVETFTGGRGAGVNGLTMVSPSGNRMVLTPIGNNLPGTTTIGAVNVGAVRFQIGSQANQFASFSLPGVFPENLGTQAILGQSLATLDLTTETGATNAIKIIDDAIQQLGVLRGKLGSFQLNFLQSNVRSLGVAEENLTASDSLIRDADMAYEMTEYTKINILRQSGMAVLAQASQSPQNVLKLLGG